MSEISDEAAEPVKPPESEESKDTAPDYDTSSSWDSSDSGSSDSGSEAGDQDMSGYAAYEMGQGIPGMH